MDVLMGLEQHILLQILRGVTSKVQAIPFECNAHCTAHVLSFHKLGATPGASHLAARYSQAYAASPGNTRRVFMD